MKWISSIFTDAPSPIELLIVVASSPAEIKEHYNARSILTYFTNIILRKDPSVLLECTQKGFLILLGFTHIIHVVLQCAMYFVIVNTCKSNNLA